MDENQKKYDSAAKVMLVIALVGFIIGWVLCVSYVAEEILLPAFEFSDTMEEME